MKNFLDMFKNFGQANRELARDRATAALDRAKWLEMRSARQLSEARAGHKKAKMALGTARSMFPPEDVPPYEENLAEKRALLSEAKATYNAAPHNRERAERAAAAGGSPDDLMQSAYMTGHQDLRLGLRAAAGDPTAVVEMVAKSLENFKVKMTESAQQLGQAATSKSAAGGGANVFGAAKSATEAFPSSPLLPFDPVSMLASLGKVTLQAVEGLQKFGETLHRDNMEFSKWSPGMARVGAIQFMKDVQFSRERGEARAGSAQELADAKHKLNQRLAPFDDAWANLKNKAGAGLLNWTADTGIPAAVYVGDTISNLINGVMTGFGASWWTGESMAERSNPLSRIMNQNTQDSGEGYGLAEHAFGLGESNYRVAANDFYDVAEFQRPERFGTQRVTR